MTKNHSSPPRRYNSGFTLIELMVAITIGLFLSAVVGGVFVSSKDAFNYQDAMSRLQENARFAMERISRDVRMAGYRGCGDLSKVANTVNNGSTSWWLNFTTPVMGYDNLSASQTLFPSAIAGSDAIVLLGVDSNDELSVISHNPVSAQIKTTQHGIQPGAILVITDCSQTSVFQMSGPTNSNANAELVVHNTGNSTSPGNCNKQLGASCPTVKEYTFKPGASLMQMYANSYYVRASATTNNGNALWSCSIIDQTNGTAQCSELINGVENMQIEYGVDTDSDTSANAYLAAGSVTDWTKVVSVRISLLMSTPPSAGNLSSKFQTYSYNGNEETASDRRVRHSYSSVINLRNRTK